MVSIRAFSTLTTRRLRCTICSMTFPGPKASTPSSSATNIGFARDPRLSYEHSFSVGKGATNWMAPTGFANTGSYLDPANANLPEPASAFQYDYPVLGLLGMVSDIVANYNYDKSGKVLNYVVDAQGNPISPTGAPVQRKYGLDWYEFYGQDSFRIKPNLTVSYGVRWSLFPPPWEVNGYQASPTCVPAVNPVTGCPSWAYNLGTEFNQDAKNMQQGIGYDATPLVSFILGGPANNGRGFYDFSKSDLSPRLSFAYSPRPEGGWLRRLFGDNDKSVIRGGFSRVYDRAGMELLSTFDANAPGGLAATVQNPCCLPGYDDAANVPRISNINQIPVFGPTKQQFFEPAPPGAFPQTPPPLGQAITWGVDQSLKTPYAWAFDLSVARELPQRFSLQVSYVGRLGRHLLTQRDLRQPIDLVDPKTGIDYFAAATRLAQLAQKGLASTQVNDAVVGKTAAFWHDMIPKAPSYEDLFTGFSGNLVASLYDLYYKSGDSYLGNEVVGLGNLDIYYGLGDNNGNTLFFNNPGGVPLPGDALNNQATTMYGWSSIGNSNYNALQASLRKQLGSGVQFDLNYTYSKSIDITSNATRLGFSSSVNVGAPGSRLVNAFDPGGRRAVSDFDTTHQINADWIAELPFGKGKPFAGNAGGVLNGFIGGWQLSGLMRWTSGFPFTVDNGNFWPTDWDEQGIANMVTKPTTGHFTQPTGAVSVFPNPTAAFSDFAHPFPGQSGSRNVVRGDGYVGVDSALAKRWPMPWEGQTLQFRWEVFNVFNQVRFNALSGLGTQACACIASLQQVPNTFGNYTGLLTQPRVMQFALRYEF